jgi:hypothetical protein
MTVVRFLELIAKIRIAKIEIAKIGFPIGMDHYCKIMIPFGMDR